MPSPFENATAVERVGEHTYLARIPDGWQQGRGAFGGVVLGTLARAMIASEPDPARTLRMLSGEICGPVLAEEARLEVTVLRRGKNLTNLDARMFQGGEVVARASAGLSTPRSTAGDVRNPPPPARKPIEEALSVTLPSPPAPVFAKHYAFSVTGPLPFSGGSEPVVHGYVRERVAPDALDAPAIIGLLDAHWPALFSVHTAPRPMATAGFAAELLVDPRTLDPTRPLFYRGEAVAQRDGFFVEMRELWSDDVLVALNQQTFAILA
ncbi:MAG: thioesterase family protein [Myxococcales bacterium]|nr:thioesterase family protein [Myxococcales bacterium]